MTNASSGCRDWMAHSNKPDVAHELGNHTSSNYPGKPRLHFDDDGPRLRQGMARRGLEAFGSSSQAEVPTFRFSGVAYAKLTPDHESAAGSSPVVAIRGLRRRGRHDRVNSGLGDRLMGCGDG